MVDGILGDGCPIIDEDGGIIRLAVDWGLKNRAPSQSSRFHHQVEPEALDQRA